MKHFAGIALASIGCAAVLAAGAAGGLSAAHATAADPCAGIDDRWADELLGPDSLLAPAWDFDALVSACACAAEPLFDDASAP